MKRPIHSLAFTLATAVALIGGPAVGAAETPAPGSVAKRKLVLIAGRPSHPPLMHEFRAGCLLLERCLQGVPGLEVEMHDGGWVDDESVLEGADAVVIFSDGGGGHPAIQDGRLERLGERIAEGMGFGCMHYGVEVPADRGGAEFKRWIGGHYEHQFSCNPIWEPAFDDLPEHPITRGVSPFQIKDEWYFNMRFLGDIAGNERVERDGVRFTPILVAKPSDDVRDGPYVYPAGPYDHIVAAGGRPEAMMWAIERPDGGRGFGFTGGHFHLNWGNDAFRRTILNALCWVAKAEVPDGGVESAVEEDDLYANLDPKGPVPRPEGKAKKDGGGKDQAAAGTGGLPAPLDGRSRPVVRGGSPFERLLLVRRER